MFKNLRKGRRGFTLVEVLVVVATLGLISSILLVTFSRVRDKSTNIAVLTQNAEYAKAVMIYSNDHNDEYPFTSVAALVTLENEANQYFMCLGTGCIFKGWNIDQSIARVFLPRTMLLSAILRPLNSYISSSANTANRLFVINEKQYRGTVYTCTTEIDGKCFAADLYYPLTGSTCPTEAIIFESDAGARAVVCFQSVESALNFSSYIESSADDGLVGGGDEDGDGVADADDNCPGSSNSYQEDEDGNGVGDACEEVEYGCVGVVASCSSYGQYGQYNCAQYYNSEEDRNLYCDFTEPNICTNKTFACSDFNEVWQCGYVPGCNWGILD